MRTRLRSAKIVDAAAEFLCACLIHDRSASGLRLAAAPDRPLPGAFCLHDDETAEVRWVAVVWRRGAQIGVRYCPSGAPPLRASDRFALGGRYYALAAR
jgi:hypothetical protein